MGSLGRHCMQEDIGSDIGRREMLGRGRNDETEVPTATGEVFSRAACCRWCNHPLRPQSSPNGLCESPIVTCQTRGARGSGV
jgi:hypothetical protein